MRQRPMPTTDAARASDDDDSDYDRVRTEQLAAEIVTMTDWYLVSDFRANSCRMPILVGIVDGHPRKKNGTLIWTSAVCELRGRLVRTAHTVYWLERVHPLYHAEVLGEHYWRFTRPLGESVLDLDRFCASADDDQRYSAFLRARWKQDPNPSIDGVPEPKRRLERPLHEYMVAKMLMRRRRWRTPEAQR